MTFGTETPTSGFIGYIPVRNIWLLLLYASRLYRELPASRRVELENAPDDIPFLVAEILANAVERRLRRNLSTRLPAAVRRSQPGPGTHRSVPYRAATVAATGQNCLRVRRTDGRHPT